MRVIALVFVAALAFAPAPLGNGRFQLDADGRPTVTVHADGTKHVFAVDTAERYTIISPTLAASLHRVVRESRPGVRTIDDVALEVLGMTLPHESLRVAAADGGDEGVVGADLFDRFVTKVDFRARRITLFPPSAQLDAKHALAIPADFANGLPVVTAAVSTGAGSPSTATLVVGLAAPPGSVSFTYRYAADAGLLDATPNVQVTLELAGLAKRAGLTARVPREPETVPLLFADGIVPARALTSGWIVFDALHHRILLG